MHQLLANWLEKLGIKDITQLRPDERETYERWKLILSKAELTVEDYMDFCRSQVGRIESKWKDTGISREERERLVDQHIVYKTLLTIHEAPKENRERLEKQLQEMIDSTPKKS